MEYNLDTSSVQIVILFVYALIYLFFFYCLANTVQSVHANVYVHYLRGEV